jgi:hypothetical protein
MKILNSFCFTLFFMILAIELVAQYPDLNRTAGRIVLPVGKVIPTREKTSTGKGWIVIEAESTKSDLGEWKKIGAGERNYVENASGNVHLEFLGGTQAGSDPASPLEYAFEVPENGNYGLIMQTSKRLEGARGDLCNDVWVKMSGDFESATNLETTILKDYLKYFQEGSVKTPEKSWHWAWRAEKGKHVFYNLVYKLKKGERYILTLAGRSQRFSIDYMVLFNINRFSFEEAKAKSSSTIAN